MQFDITKHYGMGIGVGQINFTYSDAGLVDEGKK